MYSDKEGNLLVVNIVISNTFKIIIVVLYGPNRDEPDFLQQFKIKMVGN